MLNVTGLELGKLLEFGVNPFSLADFGTIFTRGIAQKARELVNKRLLVPLKRDLYVLDKSVVGREASVLMLANRICTPSYVSRESALKFYGLIPEMVVNVTSSRLGRSVTFENARGAFLYRQVDRETYPIGLCDETDEGCPFICARPEKALYDLVVARAGLTLRARAEVRQFLYEDLRLEVGARFDVDVFDALIAVGRKRTTMELIRKELCHGQV